MKRGILEKMDGRFGELDNIKQVYLFGQTKNNEFSLVLGFELVKNSENGKKAVIDLVQHVIGNEKLLDPLDVLFIESDEWRRQIVVIENSLIYKA